MREYDLNYPLAPNGILVIKCHDDHDCVFCKHCTDIFWDFSNLIYALCCNLDLDPWNRPCDKFEDNGYKLEVEEEEL